MIPAPPGWEAHYEVHAGPKGKERRTERITPIVAWNDSGDALVVHEATGKLIPASQAGKLTYVGRTGYTDVLPGGGWMAEYREDDGTLVRYPVVAWQASAHTGLVEPVGVDDHGFPETMLTETGNFVRLWHPSWPDPNSTSAT
jgi:hypothetical protein